MKKSNSKKKRLTRDEINEQSRQLKNKRKHKGLPSGSRYQEGNSSRSQEKSSSNSDQRVGSKKVIPLVVDNNQVVAQKKTPAPTKVKPVKLTPEEELSKLESDVRLDKLLERLEQGKSLTSDEQSYVDKKLDRIEELMAILGLEFEDEDENELTNKSDDIMRLLKEG